MGSDGISRLVGAWHEREWGNRRLYACKLMKLWAEEVKEWVDEDCGKGRKKGSHKLQGEWPKEWVREPSKVLGVAEWYQESRWWSLRRRVQMALMVRRQRGVKKSPSLATPGGERLEHSSPRWVSSVSHLAPSVASARGTRRKDAGGCVILYHGPWRLNMSLKHPGAPREERKFSF